jgi:hypothetical protein
MQQLALINGGTRRGQQFVAGVVVFVSRSSVSACASVTRRSSPVACETHTDTHTRLQCLSEGCATPETQWYRRLFGGRRSYGRVAEGGRGQGIVATELRWRWSRRAQTGGSVLVRRGSYRIETRDGALRVAGRPSRRRSGRPGNV